MVALKWSFRDVNKILDYFPVYATVRYILMDCPGQGEPGSEAEAEVPRPRGDQLHHVHHRGGDGGGQHQPTEQPGDTHRIVAYSTLIQLGCVT